MTRILVLLLITQAACHRAPRHISLQLEAQSLPADGFTTIGVVTDPPSARLRIATGANVLRLEGNRIQATVLPGKAILEATAQGYLPAKTEIETTPVWTDRAHDGTPDFLRLDDPGDREAFTRSIASIAEAAFFLDPQKLPVEISDCSSLIRYAYRESFREANHDLKTNTVKPVKYQYPRTPLGPRIFRVNPGPLDPQNLAKDFAEFADADALRRFNTHFISRDVSRASRGDLLFYRQIEQRSPFHVMIALDSHRVVYHTGPSGTDKGEIRNPSIEELLRHPLPQWRPFPGNINFLGVYRWNILKTS